MVLPIFCFLVDEKIKLKVLALSFRSKPLQRPPKAAILILKMHIVWAPPGDPAYAPRRITSTASGDH